MLDPSVLALLKKGKNLLAFSAGIDSTALFFLLLEAEIDFDLALVDYGIRAQSKEELAYAKELAQCYNKTLYTHQAPGIKKDFENQARSVRYAFFETLIRKHDYTHLLTAHQLNDQLEWFLMQLSCGAGLLELLGMDTIEKRTNYTLIRPLLSQTKESLHDYLDKKGVRYFIDESNFDTSYRRNHFRHTFSDRLLKEHAKAIQKSFSYLQEDKKLLLKEIDIEPIQALTIIKAPNERALLYAVDKVLKREGYLLSGAQKAEIKRQKSIVISNRFAIELLEDKAYIAPYIKATMPKSFKERCRIKKVPLKLRAYLFSSGITLDIF